MKYLKNIKGIYICACILFMIIGLMLIGFPEFSMVAVCYIIGIMLIVLGVIKICAYFAQDKYNIAFQFDLALGILSVIIGVCAIIHHNWIINLLPIIIGIMIIADSLFTLQASIDAKRFGLPRWYLLLIFSAVSVILGLVLVFKSFKSAVAITILYGLGCFFIGFEKLVSIIYTTQRIKNKSKHNNTIDVEYSIHNDDDMG
ncbi:MAG: DUF308 domain-containing protein [Clostridia bacterium]|nr:DUF308 domain-containing protein [Clostridia bacterium]